MRKFIKILLVDDEPEWLDLLQGWLEILGIEVRRAQNGLEALRLLKSQTFDLVISDTNMPCMDGVKLLTTIRAASSDIPVIMFFSGLRGAELSREDLERCGANAVLEKQEIYTQLNPLIKGVLGAHRTPLLSL